MQVNSTNVVHSHHMYRSNTISSHQAINSMVMINNVLTRVNAISRDIHNSLVVVKIKDGINFKPWVVWDQESETVINIMENHCIRIC